MNKLTVNSSPHIRTANTTERIMLDVIIALLPTAIAGTVIFGLRELLVIFSCVAASVLSEYVYNLIVKKEQTVGDLSAVVTGLILALNLRADAPVWQCVIGSVFAIVVVKCLFGGLGCNLVNPAITARVFMLVSFASMATTQGFPTIVDTVSSATPLAAEGGPASVKLFDLFFGLTGGAIGETCAAALLLGFIYLLVRKVISWHVPVAFVGSVFALSLLMEGFNFVAALSMILSGGLLIGAIFMATDYVTSPSTASGKLIFGLGAGVLTFLIRYFGKYPEGVSFAILFMNILTPYVMSWTRRKVFGMGGTKA